MNFKASIEILRPINCIMGSLTVIIGILNTRIGVDSDRFVINIVLGIITYFFLSGSGMIINDIYDIEIDKINRPNRPIPGGRLTIYQAKQLYIITLLIGLFFAVVNSLIYAFNYLNIILAAIFGIMGLVYAKWGKKSGFLGNLLVSVSFSIGLIYGALLNTPLLPAYIYFFFLTSFFLLLSREIIKGCEDIDGDRREGVKTLAITIGIKKASIVSIIAQVLAIIFFILPLFTPIINPLAFLITMIPGLVIIGYALFLTLKNKNKTKSDFSQISKILKISGFSGIGCFIFASI